MEATQHPPTMSTWEPVVLQTDSEQDEQASTDAKKQVGLEALPEQLHADFQATASHLDEVQMNHKLVLVAAGMIPESHLAEIEPERQLAWMVEQLHGTMNPDGLSIPLMGAKASDIEISTLNDEVQRKLKIIVKEQGHDNLQRVVPLPSEAREIQAHFINGRLHLRW